MPTVSLCMIVCNEGNSIRRCLESAHEFVNEIIIVDTGSTDGTKSICESFGAKIYDYKWEDDFAAARNYSISKASCDWILLLDADEELEMRSFAELRQYLQGSVCDLIPVRMIHFYGAEPADITRSHFSGGLRLVRNGDIGFTGKIHESIVAGRQNVEWEAKTWRFVQILHYGYMEEALKSKGDRNIRMLLKEKEARPDDPWLNYYLAAEYYNRLGDFAKAYEEVIAAIAGFIKKGALPTALAYKLKYDMLISFGHFETAYNGIEKAIELYPDYVDLHFYKGILQFVYKEYEKAQESFSYCLILGEKNMKYLILSGTGSFHALSCLGFCHESRRQYEQAGEAYRQAAALLSGEAVQRAERPAQKNTSHEKENLLCQYQVSPRSPFPGMTSLIRYYLP